VFRLTKIEPETLQQIITHIGQVHPDSRQPSESVCP
jgi:hypothetical protein